MQTAEIKKIALGALEELKAENITVLDVKDRTSVTDVMIICSGRSARHVHSVAENLVKRAKENKCPPFGVDGKNSDTWVLVDLSHVMVHIMMPVTRELYQLEKLWGNE